MRTVRKIGKAQRGTYSFTDIRLERKGFLSTYSAAVSGQRNRQEVVHRGNAVVALPVDVRNREIYMIRQPRFNRAYATDDVAQAALTTASMGLPASFAVTAEQILVYESPAGLIDDGETPTEAAIRELQEETGFVVAENRLMRVAGVYPSIGMSTEFIDCYFAFLSEKPATSEARGDGSEEIELVAMSWDEAFDMLRGDAFHNGMSNIVLRQLKIMDLESKLYGKQLVFPAE